MLDSDDHFGSLIAALELEARAAAERASAARLDDGALERSGLGLARLVVKEDEPGLGGRLLVHLGRARGPEELPYHRLTAGTPVRLRGASVRLDAPASGALPGRKGSRGPSGSGAGSSRPRGAPPTGSGGGPGLPGVVLRRSRSRLVVALDADAEVPEGELRVEPTPDEVTPRRIADDLERARTGSGRLAELRAVLLGNRPATFASTPDGPVPGGLNSSQELAVRLALSAVDAALVHGPPGTGKTRTLASIVRLAVLRGERVLAMAPSHTAVDNLALRLDGHGLDLVRIGHPARVLPALMAHTLDARLERHDDVRLARRYAREASELFRRAGRFTRAKPEKGAKAEARAEARALLKDARRLEAQAADRLLDGADVVLATLGVDPLALGDRRFDLAVVDEAGQATEASTWRAVVRADRIVLAGDHLQLPPTVVSREALALDLGRSLFERLMALEPAWGHRLERQYRMHRAIMGFSNRAMYDGALIADPSVADHRLADLVGAPAEEILPLAFIDTAGAGFEEEAGADGDSRSNPKEAEALVSELRRWVDLGVPVADLGVITPYAAQARYLRAMLEDLDVEVDTVDGFQGREKEGILISLVRSNAEGEMGFLSEHRRMNVALTRARRACWVIGDAATLSGDGFYRRLVEYAEDIGGYASVWERM